MNHFKPLGALTALAILAGCAQTHVNLSPLDEKANSITVGVVQRELKTGLTGAEVITRLGSHNIVTRDKEKREVWVYDKISNNYTFSNASGKLAITLFDFDENRALFNGALAGGAASLDGRGASLGSTGASYNRSAGASAVSQKTLTIIIKFTQDGLVEDFNYHASTF